MRLRSLLLLLLLIPARPPQLTARWLDATHALIEWQSDAHTMCLWRVPAGERSGYSLDCYPGTGKLVLPGDGWNDYSRFPMPGDKYCADLDYADRICTTLEAAHVVYLPRIQATSPTEHHAWLPVVRH